MSPTHTAAVDPVDTAPPDELAHSPPYYGWHGEHDAAGSTHATPCPHCGAASGEPCRIPTGHEHLYRGSRWPTGWVHTGRLVHHEHAVWLADMRQQHDAAALAEPCVFPGCTAGPGEACLHGDARLTLALARAKESRAASDVATAFLDSVWPWHTSVCPTCGAPGSSFCRTRSGKDCMDHDEKHRTWYAQRAWLDEAIEAIETQIYACVHCQDGRRYPHDSCERAAAATANHDPTLVLPVPYHSDEARAQRIAATPALAVACPECFAKVAEECRRNVDGKYVTCRARTAALSHTRCLEGAQFTTGCAPTDQLGLWR